jgi:haloalkane dehalogenase
MIEQLDLRNITLVYQDWGGLLGLTLPMDMPDRFTRLVVMNTPLPIGEPISEAFARWKSFAAMVPEVPVAGMIMLDTLGNRTAMDALAYDAPFPDTNYMAGVRCFPQLLLVEPEMAGIDLIKRARKFFTQEWEGAVS